MRELMGAAREKDSGKLTDITSSRRLALIFDFQQTRLSGEIFLAQGEDADHAWAYPALELVRRERREVPRDWRARWTEAGGKLYGGRRMIALRGDPIWRKISRFGSPVPPFDFNSGMGLEELNRFEAEKLGLKLPEEAGEELRDESLELKEKAVEKAIAENTQAVAKTLGIKPGKPMSFKEANELRANPNFKTGKEAYRINCQSCVVANELRRRGLNVEAMPYNGQGLQNKLASGDASVMWRTQSGAVPKEVFSGKIPLFKSKKKALEDLTKSVGRYFVTVFIAKNLGHVFTAERERDGSLRLYDPQRGEVQELAVWRQIKRKYGFRILRVDNLIVAPGVLAEKRRMSLDMVIRESRENRE